MQCNGTMTVACWVRADGEGGTWSCEACEHWPPLASEHQSSQSNLSQRCCWMLGSCKVVSDEEIGSVTSSASWCNLHRYQDIFNVLQNKTILELFLASIGSWVFVAGSGCHPSTRASSSSSSHLWSGFARETPGCLLQWSQGGGHWKLRL